LTPNTKFENFEFGDTGVSENQAGKGLITLNTPDIDETLLSQTT
jgi:hypothetical protein